MMTGSMPRHGALLACTAVVLACVAFPQAVAAQGPYTFTSIQYPGATSTDATGINNAGHIVGTYRDTNNAWHGFKFDGSTYTPIEYPGANHTYAFGIGPSGQVVGSYAPNDYLGPWYGFTYTNGVYESFEVPGFYTDARAVNATGQIVGGYDSGVGTTAHGYIKNGGTITTIDVPGSAHVLATGITDAGVVAGTYVDGSNLLHGFLRVGATPVPINYPFANETYIGGINNSTRGVGWNRQGTALHGFTFSPGRFRSLDVTFPGATSTRAHSINDDGHIVGAYTSPDCPGGCAFLGRPTAGVPSCDQNFSLAHTNGTLNIGYTLTAATPTTWSTWLVIQNYPYRLFSLNAPALPTPVGGNIPIANFPAFGTVIGLSVMSTPAGGVICADVATVNTGG